MKYATKHKEKTTEYRKGYRAIHGAERRDRHLQKHYGITEGVFQLLVAYQKGECAICGTHYSKLAKGRFVGEVRLMVDHDHKTGEVRGLLCHKCNHRLDLLTDAEMVRKTLAYLTTNQKGRVAIFASI